VADDDDKGGKTPDDKTPKDDKGTAGGADKTALRDAVREVLAERDGGKGTRRRADDDGVDITAAVEAAVDKVNAKQAAAKEKETAEARLRALEDATKKPEKKPREWRRATKFMKWATDDDD
jgi:hypothetical protein